jgi:heat shock protein HslJ
VGSEWVLVALGEAAVLGGSRITLTLGPGAVRGYAGCNWYGGVATVGGGTLEIAEMSQTGRLCRDPAGVVEQEERYLRTLADAAAYRTAGDTLRLATAAGRPLLTFRRRVPLPMDPGDLVGGRWRLSGLVGRPPLTGSRITLAFGDGAIRGFAGCRRYTGTYRAEGDTIRFPRLSMLTTECEQDALGLQEGDYTTALSETTHYRLAPGRLELFTVGGETLRFHPLPAGEAD